MLSEAIEIMGWTLLHFVWQGTAAAVLLSALLLILRRASSQARYVVACAALGMIALCPIVTGVWLSISSGQPIPVPQTVATTTATAEPMGQPSPEVGWALLPVEREETGKSAHPTSVPPTLVAERPQITNTSTASVAAPDVPPWTERLQTRLAPALPWLVSGWLFGVAILSLRLLAGWLSVQRLRRRATQPAQETWQALLRRLAERLRVTRPVKLVESALVEVPTVPGTYWTRGTWDIKPVRPQLQRADLGCAGGRCEGRKGQKGRKKQKRRVRRAN